MQAKWQNKRKPVAVESSETTESLEVGEGEGAVAEGGLEGGVGGCQGWNGWVGRGTGGVVIRGGALEGV